MPSEVFIIDFVQAYSRCVHLKNLYKCVLSAQNILKFSPITPNGGGIPFVEKHLKVQKIERQIQYL
jgi:hypothetical protein